MIRKIFVETGRAFRETGQALDRLGARASGDFTSFRETWSRHRKLMNIYDKRPVVANDTFVAPSATVIGDVYLNNQSSIWYGAVVRGDTNTVRIGAVSNVQDRAVIHTGKKSADSVFPTSTTIGNYVTVGHGAVLSSCVVEDNVFIGANALVLDGALVQSNAVVEAGAVVPPGRRVPAGQVWAGNPATYVRDVSDDDKAQIVATAESYAAIAEKHSTEFLPYGSAYLNDGTYTDPYAASETAEGSK